jgi:Domain of unknown function (DUF397)
MTDLPAGADHLDWLKSSVSMASGACVEIAVAGNFVALRDSKNPTVAPFYFTRTEMLAFLDGAKRGEFDHVLGDV